MKVAIFSAFLAAFCLLLYWAANRAVYYPMQYPLGNWEQALPKGTRSHFLISTDGTRLHSWELHPVQSKTVTLFLHGNAGNLSHRVPFLEVMAELGLAVLLVDYRGYGKSEGSPSEAGLYHDAETAWGFLTSTGWDPRRIVLHGESLGTAVAVELATRHRCGGVILEAPFSSAAAVAGNVVPWLGPALVRGYDSKSKIGRIGAPLLILHGDRDEVIPVQLSQDLFSAAAEPKEFWLVRGAGHNTLAASAGPEYPKKLMEFHERVASAAVDTIKP